MVICKAQPTRGRKQRFVELAAVVAQRRDFALEQRLRVGGAALLRLQCVELLRRAALSPGGLGC